MLFGFGALCSWVFPCHDAVVFGWLRRHVPRKSCTVYPKDSLLNHFEEETGDTNSGSVVTHTCTHTHTHTYTFNGPLSRTTQVSRYQRGTTNLDFTEARVAVSGNGISWAICKSAPRCRQIASPAPHYSVFLQAGCPSCRQTNSFKALKLVVKTEIG